MRVVIDRHIPFLREVLSEVSSTNWQFDFIEPTDFTNRFLRDADALIIRTRTRIDEALLHGTKVHFVASATIGIDHIDTRFCQKNDIHYVACPGCNAQAVCDYVEEAITTLKDYLPPHPTLGIIGVGHIGSLVQKMALKKGLRVLLNDPPKSIGIPLDELVPQCDIITFHTPLTNEPPYPTFHLCSSAFLALCRPNVVLINAARGGVIDEQALLEGIIRQKIGGIVIDCWENEPNIDKRLLGISIPHLFSYHIAGYSQQGKLNASQTCLIELCHFFGLPPLTIDKKLLNLQAGDSRQGWLKRVSQKLLSTPDKFETLRKEYILR